MQDSIAGLLGAWMEVVGVALDIIPFFLAGFAMTSVFTTVSYYIRSSTKSQNDRVSITLAPLSWSAMIGVSRLGGQYIGFGGVLAIPIIAGLVNMYNENYGIAHDVELRLGVEVLAAYFASLFFTIGSIIVSMTAPGTIKIFGNKHNFVEKSPEYQNYDQNTHQVVPIGGPSQLEQVVDRLGSNWAEFEAKRPWPKLVAATFFLFSALCFSYILLYRAPLRVISAAMGL